MTERDPAVTLPMFDAPDPEPGPKPSRAQRRRARQANAIAGGWHPLSVALASWLPLHPEAREEEGPTCGDCRLRRMLNFGTERNYPKCTAYAQWRGFSDANGLSREWIAYPRVTHGEATDVAASWPACADFEPRRHTPRIQTIQPRGGVL